MPLRSGTWHQRNVRGHDEAIERIESAIRWHQSPAGRRVSRPGRLEAHATAIVPEIYDATLADSNLTVKN